MTNNMSKIKRNKQTNNKVLITMTTQTLILQSFNREYRQHNNNKKTNQPKSNLLVHKSKQACYNTKYKSFFHNLKKENNPTYNTSRKNINNLMD